jgi:Na+/proline symporter
MVVDLPLQLVPPELGSRIASNFGISIAIFVLYAIAFVAVSGLARRKFTGSVTDYVVASRGLGWFVTSITILATGFSGVGVAGFPGTIWQIGAPFLVAVLTGFAATAPLMWYFGGRIWALGNKFDFETPGDLLGEYYGSDLIRVYSVVASIVFNIAYLVGQLLAGGILINVLTGGLVPFNIGMAAMAVVILAHVSLTGVRGIAYLDTFNGVLISIILTVFGLYIVGAAGGLGGVFNALPAALQPKFIATPSVIGIFTPELIIAFGIIFTLGTWLMSPAIWIRLYSFDKRINITRIVVTLLAFLAVTWMFGLFLIASWGKSVFPEISNPDFVSSLLAFEAMPFALAVLFLVAVLAAVISTADSYLHALSAITTRDLFKAIFDEEMDGDTELRYNYGVMVVATLIGIVSALFYPGLITPLAAFAGAFTIMLLPPLVGAVAWPRASTEAAIVAPAVGLVLVLAYQFGAPIPNPFPVPLAPGLVVAFAANVVLFVVISFATRPVAMDRIEAFHGVLNE